MKRRITILITVVGFLLLGTVASAQSDRPGQSLEYTVQAVMVTGGRYQLIGLGSQIGGTSSGGAYRLLNLTASLASSDGGCCCTYLPCLLR